MNTTDKIPTIARLSLSVKPERMTEFEALYEEKLAPILKMHGLKEGCKQERNMPAHSFGRLFEVASLSDLEEKRQTLQKDVVWQKALKSLETDFTVPWRPGGIIQHGLEIYTTPAGSSRSILVNSCPVVPVGRGKGHWRTYDATDGLDGGAVRSILQDQKGDLWFATGAGVVRWDGLTFTGFTVKDGLISNLVFSIFQDREGALWFGGIGGAVRWDGQTFTPFTAKDGLVLSVVMSIFQDREGALWFGGGGGVVRWDGQTFTPFTAKDGLILSGVRSIVQDKDGVLWFGGSGGVVQYDPSASLKTGSQSFTHFTTKEGLVSNSTRLVFQDRDGILWFGGPGGAVRYDGKVCTLLTAQDGLINNDVHAIFQDREGAIWFGTAGGVNRYDPSLGFQSEQTAWTTYTISDGLATNLVWSIFQDRDGVLWFGTSGGANRYDGQSFVAFTPKNGLPDNVFSILRDRDGALWLTSQGGGFSCFDGQNVTALTTTEGLPNNVVQPAIQDRDGVFWFGTNEGLCRYDEQHLTVYTKDDGLAGNHIQGIFQDRDGVFWFGTVDGVTRYDGESFATFTMADGLAGNYVWTIFQDRDGMLWFGGNGGVVRYDGRMFTRFATEDGVGINTLIVSMIQDRDGMFWFGSMIGEVICSDGKRFTPGASENGLASNMIRSILQDRKGHFWFGTTGGGVSRFDGRVFQTLTKEDGLTGNVVYALHEDSDGTIWIGTTGGLIRFRPQPPVPPPVFIDAVVADQRYEHPTNLKIPAFARLTAFDFHGKSLKTRPDAMVYRYRLIGYDGDWKTTRARHVEYQDLPVGDYTFEVVAVDRDLVYSEFPATVRLQIVRDTRDEQIDELERRVRQRTQELADANRELTLEAALERVRSKALSMQKPEDIAGVTETLFAEFHAVGFSPWRVAIRVTDEDGGVSRLWAFREGKITRYELPLARLKEDISVQEAQKARQSGVPWILWKVEGWTAVTEHFKSIQKLRGFSEEWLQEILQRCPDSVYEYFIFHSRGGLSLHMIRPMTEVELSESKRFADVFDFAYTRFLELKSAEEQTRQAERRAAVDRVRAEATAMRSTDDFIHVLDALWHGLKAQLSPFSFFEAQIVDPEMKIFSEYGIGDHPLIVEKSPNLLIRHEAEGIPAWRHDHTFEEMKNDTMMDMNSWSRERGWPKLSQIFQMDAAFIAFIEKMFKWSPGDDAKHIGGFCMRAGHGSAAIAVVAEPDTQFTQEDLAVLETFVSAASIGYTRYLDFQKLEAQNQALSSANRELFKVNVDLENANTEIQTQTERKSAFLASMSHELRTPMNAIKGFTSLVLRRSGDALPERQRENLQKVGQASDHLLTMINDLLDLSKIEAGHMDVHPTTFTVKHLITYCVSTVNPLVKDDVSLSYECDNIGQAHTDEARLRQMVINLLSNAIKFTDVGEVRVTVTSRESRVTSQKSTEVERHESRVAGQKPIAPDGGGELTTHDPRPTTDFLEIAVSDTGKGIPKDELPFIFDEYRQVKGSESSVQKGTGLGLSITKKFAELLGGTIDVKSEMDKGSIFIVRIPAVYKER